jgi:putative holliday junction resolvase
MSFFADGTTPRILAIDYGLSRVGLAISDPLGMFATGLQTLANPGKKALWSGLRTIVGEYEPVRLVLGLPLNMNGSEGEQAAITYAFADEWLKRFPKIPITLWDERLTSRLAEQTLHAMGKKPGKNKGDVDQLSAMRLLQEFLDSQGITANQDV